MGRRHFPPRAPAFSLSPPGSEFPRAGLKLWAQLLPPHHLSVYCPLIVLDPGHTLLVPEPLWVVPGGQPQALPLATNLMGETEQDTMTEQDDPC